jgi:hypothetical protein
MHATTRDLFVTHKNGILYHRFFCYGLILIIGLYPFLIKTPIVEAGISGPEFKIFPPSSKPFGLSYGEWSAEWWKWLSSIPGETNPSNDPVGKYCKTNQNGPVWFLAGSAGETQNRRCDVPAGKAILFPALTTECSYAETLNAEDLEDLESCAINEHEVQIVGDEVSKEVTIDGEEIKNLDDFRVQSPPFNFTFPAKNLFGAQPGPTTGVSDGWFIMLEPLSPGNHTVSFSGKVYRPLGGGFSTSATYLLNVMAN